MKVVKNVCKYYRNLVDRIREGKTMFMKLNFSVRSEQLMQAIIELGKVNVIKKDGSYFSSIAKKYDIIQKQTESPSEFIALCLNYYFADRQLIPDVSMFIFDKKNIVFSYENDIVIKSELNRIIRELAIYINLNYNFSDAYYYIDAVSKRICDVEEFYCEQNGKWLEQFIDGLGDEVSVSSFKSFLKQRAHGQILWDSRALYPIQPPKITKSWRDSRMSQNISLPKLRGADKEWLDLVLIDTFVLEQYAVPGVVEAQPGDTVIDAGAYIGDTALYFAEKVGKSGRVYAFEAVPETVKAAQENLQANFHEAVVEIVPSALSDSDKTLMFNVDLWSTAFGVSEKGTLPVQAVTLDSFVKERELHVDFIKSDLEGSDIDMLEGARKTLRRDGPTCGLALYHQQDHFIRIPQILAEERDDYVFFFRSEAEPVLLAITKEKLKARKKEYKSSAGDIEKKIVEDKIFLILQNLQPDFKFDDNIDFIESGLLDSFDVVQLVSELESEFNIVISALDILPENFSSVSAISQLVRRSPVK